MEAKKIMIPRELAEALARDGTRLSLSSVRLIGGRTRRLVECELKAGEWRHRYTVDCGTPDGQGEFAKALADALGRYAVVYGPDRLGDEYFRSRISAQRDPGDVPLFAEARMRGRDVHARVDGIARLAATVAYGDPNAVLGPMRRPLVRQLAETASEYVESLDREFELGRYQAPDVVPDDYDGEDYYMDYQKAVDSVVAARIKLTGLVAEAERPAEEEG